MRPEQLGDFKTPSDPQMHPDGNRVVFVVSQMDLERDRYVRRLHLWDGEAMRPLTSGPGDSSPRISPDGKSVAFLRKTEGGHAQVAVLPLDGGEAEVATELPHGATELIWSPDGTGLGLVAAPEDRREDAAEPEELARLPRRITRFPYRFDEVGWLRPSNLHVLDIAEGSLTQITDGDSRDHSIAWHPDGSEIAFAAARHETAGLDQGAQLWTVPVAGGAASARTAVGLWEAPTYDASGALHAVGGGPVGSDPSVHPFVRIGKDGKPTPMCPGLDRNVVFYSALMAPAVPQWLDDGSAVVAVEDRGTVRVERISRAGERVALVGGHRVVTGAAPRRDGTAMAFVATTVTNPGELWWWDDGGERQLTHLNKDFAIDAGLVEPQSFVLKHEGVEIEGWIYLPPGDERVPVLLNIHGGPASQYGWSFMDEFQVYVGGGYGVVATNPRGSAGYGTDHLRSIVGTWQEGDPPDMRDLVATVDAAAAVEARLDTDRLGVMGGSYGALATIRVLTIDQRYNSAVAERGLYSFGSFSGTSDIGP